MLGFIILGVIAAGYAIGGVVFRKQFPLDKMSMRLKRGQNTVVRFNPYWLTTWRKNL
jgi:hypothetical protein